MAARLPQRPPRQRQLVLLSSMARIVVLALLLPFLDGDAAGAAGAGEDPGPRLSVPLQETILRLQDQWLVWNSALLQGDEELARSLIRDLRSTAAEMGFERLPELSLGAVARAVEVARGGDPASGMWALAMAEELDRGRPETCFGRSRVAWLEGRHFTSAFELARGYARTVRVPAQRRLWLGDLIFWLVASLLITAAFFVAIQMATKGEHLFRDLAATTSTLVPKAAGYGLGVAVLGWPFLLPMGWVWVLLYWAIILWGYSSSSERWGLVAVLATVGLAPIVIAFQVARLPGQLSREVRVVDSLQNGRLYGELFSDLGALTKALPEEAAVDQMMGDLHVGLGQDDYARPHYRAVLEREPLNGAALNNLGVFHFNRAEYVRGIEFFDRAKVLPESALEATYNQASSYRRLLEFDNLDLVSGEARRIDAQAVAAWLAADRATVTMRGGVARASEVRRLLVERSARELTDWRRWSLAALVALAALALAAVLPSLGLRARGGWRTYQPVQENFVERWTRRLMPGVVSAETGDGGRTYLAILVPVTALLLPFSGLFSFRVPWGFDPGLIVVWVVTLAGLTVFALLRWRWS